MQDWPVLAREELYSSSDPPLLFIPSCTIWYPHSPYKNIEYQISSTSDRSIQFYIRSRPQLGCLEITYPHT